VYSLYSPTAVDQWKLLAPMAVELNLPADTDQAEEGQARPAQDLQETVEPEQEVPASSSTYADSMSVLTEKTGSEPPIEAKDRDAESNQISDIQNTEDMTLGDAPIAPEPMETANDEVTLRNKGPEMEDKDVRRGSTFLTEVEDSEDGNQSVPRRGSIVDRILAETETDGKTEKKEVVEPECVEIKVAPLGTTTDEIDNKTGDKDAVETLGSIVDMDKSDHDRADIVDSKLATETTLEPKDISTDSKEEKILISSTNEEDKSISGSDDKTAKDGTKEEILIVKSAPDHVLLAAKVEEVEDTESEVLSDSSLCEDVQLKSDDNKQSNSENIGTIRDLKSEVNSLLAPLEAEKEDKSLLETASTAAATEIEEALSEIPEMSSSVSAQDLLDDTDKDDTVKERQPEKISEGALIDITVIEEPEGKEKNTDDAVEEAREAFIAEVIPDNADIEIEAVEGEEVLELNLDKDAIPLGAIAVAAFAIFLALVFFYN